MQGEIITIATDGTVSRQPADVEHLPALKAAVGGIIGYVGGFSLYEGRSCDAYVNDESLLDGLPQNLEATRLWHEQLDDFRRPQAGHLHGPLAIVIGDAEFMRAQREF